MPIVAPSVAVDRIKIKDVREQTKLLVEAAVNPVAVRVHKEWKLKLDFGKITSLLKTESNQIHAWMIGAASIITQTTANGDYEFVGGRRADREVLITVWGFFDSMLKNPDRDDLSSQDIAEIESEQVADYFLANPTLGFDTKPKGLKSVKPFQIENIDTHSFSDGSDVVVSQCSFRVVLTR